MSTQREDILGCACELFTEEGLEGFSMRRLARSVGVTAPALYRHFDGKEDVLVGVVGEAFKVLSRYLYGALGAPTPMGRLLQASDAYLNYALDHPRFYETIHAPLHALGIEELPEGVFKQACSVGQFWLDRHRELLDEGLIRESDANLMSLTMWAHGHGLISLYRSGMMGDIDDGAIRKLYRKSALRVLRGVATEKGMAAAEEVGWPPVEADEVDMRGDGSDVQARADTPADRDEGPSTIDKTARSAAAAAAAGMTDGMTGDLDVGEAGSDDMDDSSSTNGDAEHGR